MKIYTPTVVIFFLLLLPCAVYAADTANVSVSAVVLSKNNCKFATASAAINFGNLDPANTNDVNATASIGFRCGGASPTVSFSITDDDGLYETGVNANRMRHSTILAEYLPYTLALNPSSGTMPKNIERTLTITGTVRSADYRNASIGSYADIVIISINP